MRNCIVVGCGRSGTSMVAGALAGAGYHMGSHLWPADAGNPKGYFESAVVNGINEQVLRLSTPALFRSRSSWLRAWGRVLGYEFINQQTLRHSSKEQLKRLVARLRPPGQRSSAFEATVLPRRLPYGNLNWLARVAVNTPMKTNAWLNQQISTLVQQQPYCFKDPRFCYTLPVWRPFLQDTRFICIFRQPALTATSLLTAVAAMPRQSQPTLTFPDALQLWNLMYQHILLRHRHQGEWLFLHVQQLFHRTGIERLEAFIEAKIDRNFPDRSLQRTLSQQPVPPESQQIYAHLCQLAAYAV